MNPIVLFDYIFYSIEKFNSSVLGLEYQKRFGGVVTLSLFQFLNCMIIYKYLTPGKYINKYIVIMIATVYIIINVLNFIRYYKFVHLETLERKWEKDKLYIRLIKIAFTVCYIVLSFALLGIVSSKE